MQTPSSSRTTHAGRKVFNKDRPLPTAGINLITGEATPQIRRATLQSAPHRYRKHTHSADTVDEVKLQYKEDEEGEYDDEEEENPDVVYAASVRRQRTRHITTVSSMTTAKRVFFRRLSWSQILLCGSCVCLSLLILISYLSSVATSWIATVQYGMPRRTQVEMAVHHTSADTVSYFSAVNLHGHVTVFECMDDSCNEVHVYKLTALDQMPSDAPVSIAFLDTTGSGHLDMVIRCSTQYTVLLNTPKGYVAATHFTQHQAEIIKEYITTHQE